MSIVRGGKNNDEGRKKEEMKSRRNKKKTKPNEKGVCKGGTGVSRLHRCAKVAQVCKGSIGVQRCHGCVKNHRRPNDGTKRTS